jgi:hypothetical protein
MKNLTKLEEQEIREKIQYIMNRDELSIRKADRNAKVKGLTKGDMFFSRLRQYNPKLFLTILEENSCNISNRYIKYTNKKKQLLNELKEMYKQLGSYKAMQIAKQYGLSASFLAKNRTKTNRTVEDLKKIRDIFEMYI